MNAQSTAPGLDSRTRLAIMDLRSRIEEIAVKSVIDSFPYGDVTPKRNRIHERLAFIPVAYATDSNQYDLIVMVRFARYIYKRTSDVLHGRSNMVNLSRVLLAEWIAFVEHLEDLIESRDTARV